MNCKLKIKILRFLCLLCLPASLLLVSCEAASALDDPGPAETAETAQAAEIPETGPEPEYIMNMGFDAPQSEEAAGETEGSGLLSGFPIYEINPKFHDLLNINNDIVGEVSIEGTVIDFPVVYNGDNDYYLKHDIYGNETKYGAVFMEMMNRGAILDRNTVLHGHNFRGTDNSMFADLEKFKKRDFFEANKTIIFNNLYSDMEWEVFSVYVTSEAEYYLITEFASDGDYIDFAEFVKSRSMFESGYRPGAGDYMLTLHTCSYEFENAHTLVHARLVKKTDNLKNP